MSSEEKKKAKYIVVTADDLSSLAAKINIAMDEDYIPVGGFYTEKNRVVGPQGALAWINEKEITHYYQPMILKS